MFRYVWIFLMAGVLLGCSTKKAPPQAPPVISNVMTAEDYHLFSIILRDRMNATKWRCVISRTTVPFSRLQSHQGLKSLQVEPAQQSLLRGIQNDQTTVSLSAGFDADLNIVLASASEIQAGAGVNEGFWSQFKKKYPQSHWVVLSTTVWNHEKTEALIFASDYADGEAGEGNLYFLSKDEISGRWMIRNTCCLWIS